ncbi:MAG: hypothetical protein KDB14_02240 [Planctomycetales bacterium]|nr:hypothetical protein [Planctomycetales bacterium]
MSENVPVFQQQQLRVAQSLVAFDPESELCGQVLCQFASRMASVDPLLGELLSGHPITPGTDCSLEALMAVDHGQWTLLNQRLEVFLPTCCDGDLAPSLYLVLDAAWFVDAERRDLFAAWLLEFISDCSSCVVLLVDGDGQLLPRGVGLETLEQWLRPLAGAGVPIHLYLASTVLDDGRPVEPAELAAALSLMLHADVCVPTPYSERLLSGTRDGAVATLSCLGVRASGLQMERVDRRLSPRLLDELLQSSLLQRQPVVSPSLSGGKRGNSWSDVRGLSELLPLAFPTSRERILFHSGPPQQAEHFDTPSLLLEDGRCTVELGAIADEVDLDQVPRKLWPARLLEMDGSARQERVSMLIAQTTEEVTRLSHADLARAEREFWEVASRHGLTAAAASCSRWLEHVQRRFDVSLQRGHPSAFDEHVEQLRQALTTLDRLPRLWLVALGLLIGALSLHVLDWGALVALKAFVVQAAAFCGLGVALSAITLQWWWHRRALRLRNKALEQIIRRGQSQFCNEMLANLTSLKAQHLARLRHDAVVMERLGTLLHDRERTTFDGASTTAWRCVEDPFTAERWDEAYRLMFPSRFTGDGALERRFQAELVEWLAEVAAGGDAAELARRARQFALDVTRQLASIHLRLWKFFACRLADDDLDDDQVEQRRAELAEGAALLKGKLVRHALGDPSRKSRLWLAPVPLQSTTPPAMDPQFAIAGDNLWACLQRIELVRCVSANQPFVEENQANDRVSAFQG